jgi:60 kDa SS-A/Ro ribonucleoprotein
VAGRTPAEGLAPDLTSCPNNSFHATADEQLDHVLALARELEPDFVAQTALHARQAGHMKDMPALLLALPG